MFITQLQMKDAFVYHVIITYQQRGHDCQSFSAITGTAVTTGRQQSRYLITLTSEKVCHGQMYRSLDRSHAQLTNQIAELRVVYFS